MPSAFNKSTGCNLLHFWRRDILQVFNSIIKCSSSLEDLCRNCRSLLLHRQLKILNPLNDWLERIIHSRTWKSDIWKKGWSHYTNVFSIFVLVSMWTPCGPCCIVVLDWYFEKQRSRDTSARSSISDYVECDLDTSSLKFVILQTAL